MLLTNNGEKGYVLQRSGDRKYAEDHQSNHTPHNRASRMLGDDVQCDGKCQDVRSHAEDAVDDICDTEYFATDGAQEHLSDITVVCNLERYQYLVASARTRQDGLPEGTSS